MTPPSTHPIQADIPFRPTEEILPNGATLVCLPMPNEHLLRMDVCFPGGRSLQNTPLQAQLAISQLGEGSRRYPSTRVAERLDYYSATLQTTCNFCIAGLSLICLPRFLPRILPILRSLLDEPSYGRRRLHQAVDTARANWLIARQRVDKVANKALFGHIFPPGNPLAHQLEERHFSQITPALLRSYHDHAFCASHATIFLTGALAPDSEQHVRNALGTDPWGGRHPAPIRWPDLPQSPACYTRYDEPMPTVTVQSALRMAFLLPPLDHPDMPLLRLAGTILGGYFGSRLMSNIREDKGYTYHIGNQMLQYPGGTLLVIATEVGSSFTEQTITEILREIQRMADQPVPDDEMSLVKNYLSGRACRQYEPHISLTDLLISLHYSRRTIDSLLAENQALQGATAGDVQRVVRQYFNPEHAICCVAAGLPPELPKTR